MRPVTYKTNITDGDVVETVELTGYPTGTPGLLVGEAYKPCQNSGQEWMVVHARTGTVVPYCWDSPEGALAYAENVAWLGDWQQDHDATKRLVTGVKRLLCDYAYDLGGRMHYAGGLADGSVDNGVIA